MRTSSIKFTYYFGCILTASSLSVAMEKEAESPQVQHGEFQYDFSKIDLVKTFLTEHPPEDRVKQLKNISLERLRKLDDTLLRKLKSSQRSVLLSEAEGCLSQCHMNYEFDAIEGFGFFSALVEEMAKRYKKEECHLDWFDAVVEEKFPDKVAIFAQFKSLVISNKELCYDAWIQSRLQERKGYETQIASLRALYNEWDPYLIDGFIFHLLNIGEIYRYNNNDEVSENVPTEVAQHYLNILYNSGFLVDGIVAQNYRYDVTAKVSAYKMRNPSVKVLKLGGGSYHNMTFKRDALTVDIDPLMNPIIVSDVHDKAFLRALRDNYENYFEEIVDISTMGEDLPLLKADPETLATVFEILAVGGRLYAKPFIGEGHYGTLDDRIKEIFKAAGFEAIFSTTTGALIGFTKPHAP